MIINNLLKARNRVLATVLITGLGFVDHASADLFYLVDLNSKSVTEVGTLGMRYDTRAEEINDAGQVVGSSLKNLGSHVERRPFVTDPNGLGIRDLGTLGGTHSFATGINSIGQVVGASSTTAEGHLRAFIIGPDGNGMRDLGTLGGFYSWADAVNDTGQVVGDSDMVEGSYSPHAFITGPEGMGMRDLGTLGGDQSWANGINNAAQVVGSSYTAEGGERAFITGPNGMGMRDLGTLGGANSSSKGINNAGRVVGSSDTAEGVAHAFITGPNGEGIMDLNSLVDMPEGIILTGAIDINNTGQVLAVSSVPEPQIYALMLVGLGLIGFMARRKKADNLIKRYRH